MTSLSRRLISAVCAVTLATSLVPTPAFAETPSGGGIPDIEPVTITVDAETSAEAMSQLIQPFALNSFGPVPLKSTNEVRWIDRLDLSGYDAVRGFYDALVEASDNDGDRDFLIEDRYFNGEVDSNNGGLAIGSYNKEHASIVAYVGNYTSEEEFNENFSRALPYIYGMVAAFDRDHPEVFWLGGLCKLAAWGIGGTFYVGYQLRTEIRNNMYISENEVRQGLQERDANTEKILASVKNITDASSKVRGFNKWLTEHNAYNTNLANAEANYHDAWECISALSGKVGTEGPVCEGYARAFKVLCDQVGIPCVLVDGNAKQSTSSAGEGHMWNYVRAEDGKWYAVDVTWNDPNSGNIAFSGDENENWLLIGADTTIGGMKFQQSHPVSNKMFVDSVSSDGTTIYQASFPNGPNLASEKYAFYDCSKSGHKDGVGSRENEVSATCIQVGSYEHVLYCPACGLELERKMLTVSSLGHDFRNYIYDGNASCTENGTETGHCIRCQEANTQEAKNTALGHTSTAFEKNNDATCTQDGTKTFICDRCGKKSTEVDPGSALGHSYGAWRIVKAATCTAAGFEQRVCSRDGSHVETREIPKLAHSYGAWQTVKAATCTMAGTERRVCKACGDSATHTVPARGHNFGAYRSNGDAQVNVDGTETARCSRCSATQTRTAAGSALAPTVGQTVAAAGATYQATGTTTVTYAGPSNKKATSVTVPATVTISGRTYQVTSIASKAFAGNKALKSVKIGANVKSVLANAFKGCTKLASVSFGNGITSIGKNAFSGCKALKSVTLGTKVTTIGDGAFQNCAKLTKVTVKATKLSKIGKNAFAGCKKLGALTLKTTKLKSIGKNAFKGTKSKLTVKVPKKKLKAYQKLCKNKGCKTIRVKK